MVPHSHLDGLEVGDELELNCAGKVELGQGADLLGQLSLQRVLEHEDILGAGGGDQLLNEVYNLLNPVTALVNLNRIWFRRVLKWE